MHPSVPGNLYVWFGTLGYLSLFFTPGAWMAFGLALDGIPFWSRVMLSTVLSPLIVCVEFYSVRLLGVPFGPAAVVLVFLNLPAIYFIYKRRAGIVSLRPADWLVGAVAVVIPLICMIPVLAYADARLQSPHGFLHADMIYEFARGGLILETPTLAGVRASFPVWGGLAFQAVQSFLGNSPPVSCFVWNNLISLIAVCGFAAGITKAMGGHKLAQVSSAIFLLIGANPVGWILMQLVPAGASQGLWGDMRYTPWVSKFLDFGPMPLALGMLSAMIYLLVRSEALTKQLLLIAGVLLVGIGLLYPLLLPPSCALVGVKALAPLLEKRILRGIPYKQFFALAALILIAVLLTYGEVRFINSDRQVTTGQIMLSALPSALRKTFESLIATCLFVGAIAFTFRRCWKDKRPATVLLLGTALLCYMSYAVFYIPYYENEYKFIFAVVMCLAAFPAIAVERIWREWPRTRSTPVLAVTAVLLLATYGHLTWRYWFSPWSDPNVRPDIRKYDPPLNATEFYLQLDQREKWSGICTAVRRLSPPDSVLIVSNGSFYFPILTARSMYVSAESRNYPGVNHKVDVLDAGLRGYGRQILQKRRATLSEFFNAANNDQRDQALDLFLALKRPLAVIAEPQHLGLIEWLRGKGTAVEVYSENGLNLWLIKGQNSTLR